MRLAARPTSLRIGGGSASDPYPDLVRALGPDHRLVRTHRSLTITIRHTVNGCVLIVAAPFLDLVSRSLAVTATASATLVTSILCAAVAILGAQRRRRIHDLILEGSAPQLGLIQAEVSRLLDPRHRAQSARALTRALSDAEHWHDLLPASRPPPSVRHLAPHAPLIRALARALCSHGVSPRAVILTDRLIEGGYGGTLYARDPDRVRRELGRIRFELDSDRLSDRLQAGSAARFPPTQMSPYD
jgi:hypothetical protein